MLAERRTAPASMMTWRKGDGQIENDVGVVPQAKAVIEVNANANAPATEIPASAKAKEKRNKVEGNNNNRKKRAPSNAIAAQSLVQVGAEPGCTDASNEMPSTASPTMAAAAVIPAA